MKRLLRALMRLLTAPARAWRQFTAAVDEYQRIQQTPDEKLPDVEEPDLRIECDVHGRAKVTAADCDVGVENIVPEINFPPPEPPAFGEAR